MPIENMSLPWWMGPSKAPWEALLEGVQAGSQIRANQIRTQGMMAEIEQGLQRQEAAAQMKMMDLALEGERNQLAKESFQARQTAELLKGRGLSEMSTHIAESIMADKLADPEAIAKFWNIAGRYGAILPNETVNSLYDNNFGAAQVRKEKAANASHTLDAPASVDEFNFRETLRAKYRDETDPILKAERLDDLRRFEMKAGFTKGDPTAIEEVIGPDGRSHQVLRSATGQTKLLPAVDESKISPVDLAAYRAELKALQDAWTNMDDVIRTDQKPDAEKYRRLRDELYQRFSKVKSRATPSSPASAVAPTNPADRKKDSVYQTPRGPLKWTGTGWVAP